MKHAEVETVGLRELGNSLSAFVRKVTQGIRVLITDRGRVIAEIRSAQLNLPTEESGLLMEMQNRGELRCGSVKKSPFPRGENLLKGGTVQSILDELRGEK